MGLIALSAHPASAEPRPRKDEWWFPAWEIENAVWPLSKGAGITVGVLDSGVNPHLPELAGVVLKGADTAGGKSNGRKDLDVKEDGHGTTMAIMIAGQGGGSSGFVGIAPEAKILPVHVMSIDVLGPDRVDSDKAIADGIRFAVGKGAKVLNLSFGAGAPGTPDQCSREVRDAVTYAIQHDVVTVAAAGDTGNTNNFAEAPASCPGVLAVGGVDSDLRPWKGTQRQPYVAVAAPASGSVAIGKTGTVYSDAQGTSASAALVSGAVALVRAHNPQMSGRTVVQRLVATALPVSKPVPDKATGYGAIRIARAIDPAKYPVPADAPNPVYDRFDQSQRAAHKAMAATATPASETHRSGSSSISPAIYAALVGLAAVLIGCLAFLWLRHHRLSGAKRNGTKGSLT
ncbi:S8 family serine peptidase [Actinomadura montaniterrae]|uniref:S8 family serine peptidase n=1 Tax=Actinomadura montaniterrae TaxID=1803903 RepID=UPI00178C40A2|nr:S8 family serine peptidase [Actinomadura montaniterrae]